METLGAIYGADAAVIHSRRLQLMLDDGRTVLDLRLASPRQYPEKPPLIALRYHFQTGSSKFLSLPDPAVAIFGVHRALNKF